MKSTDMRRKRSLKVSGAHPMETLGIPQPMPQEARKDTKGREEACREAILRVFLEKTNVIAYRYEVAKDETTLWQAAPGEEMKEAHRANFYDYFTNEVLADADQREEVLARLTDACRRIRDDVVEYRVKTKDGSPLWRRTSYRSLAAEDGQIYAVVGLMEELHDTTHMMERQEAQLKRDPQTRLFDREGLELLVNHQLTNLLRGEKGVLFIVGIDDYEELCEALGESACNGYIGTLSDSVRADFRGVDVFGRVKRDEVAVFISGRISIDIIESARSAFSISFCACSHRIMRRYRSAWAYRSRDCLQRHLIIWSMRRKKPCCQRAGSGRIVAACTTKSRDEVCS